jgi:serine/threonine protein kinase
MNDDHISFDKVHILTSASGAHYQIGRMLKKAIYGAVLHSTVLMPNKSAANSYTRTSTTVAIKVYSKKIIYEQGSKSQENPFNEIAALQYVGDDHPNIVGQIECCSDEENIYSIMPFVEGGELFDYVVSKGRLSENEARKIMRQVLLGLLRLHELGVAHRDVSLENILYDSDRQQAMIIDLGLCIKLNRDLYTTRAADAENQRTGKANYMPPEVVNGTYLVDPFAGDIWSAGVSLLYLLLGFPPMERATEDDVRFGYVLRGELPILVQHWGVEVSSSAMDLIVKMLAVDWRQRPSLWECLAHPWMQEDQLNNKLTVGECIISTGLRWTNRDDFNINNHSNSNTNPNTSAMAC